MKHAFVRRYNPAYDGFLIRYFNQDGIEFDRETTFADVRPRWILAESMKNPSPQEKLFCAYASNWRMHPEARPCYHELFDKAIGGTGQPDFEKLRKLQLELEDPKAKLLFSRQDVAQTISDYYRRFLRDPLKQELEVGHGGRDILKYFTSNELHFLPQSEGDIEKSEEMWNEAAGKLVLWFDSITPRSVESEIEKVLADHEMSDHHIVAPNPELKPEDQAWSCSHELPLVRLSTHRRLNGTRPAVWLDPTRGYDAAEHVIEPGWNIVAFPQYLVIEAED